VSAEFSLLLLMMMTVTLLLKLDGDDPETHYRHTLEGLGRRSGTPDMIFRNARRGLRARFQTTQARLSGMRIPA
jgi:hypothetical protein